MQYRALAASAEAPAAKPVPDITKLAFLFSGSPVADGSVVWFPEQICTDATAGGLDDYFKDFFSRTIIGGTVETVKLPELPCDATEKMKDDYEERVRNAKKAISKFVWVALDHHLIGPEYSITLKGDSTPGKSILERCGEAGLLGLAVPEEFGGMGASKIVKTLADLYAWYALGSIGSLIRVHGGVGTLPILYFGSEEQKAKWLPQLASGQKIGVYLLTEPNSGSDSLGGKSGIRTTAVLKTDASSGEEYWELNGSKTFITNGRYGRQNGVFIIFARVQQPDGKWQLNTFVVDTDELEGQQEALQMTGEEDQVGLHASSTAAFGISNLRIPKGNILQVPEGHPLRKIFDPGTAIGFSILNHGRMSVSAGALGGSMRDLEATLKYATERRLFGGIQLTEFGDVKVQIAEMAASIFAQESVVFATSGRFDSKAKDPAVEAACAKVFCSDQLVRENGGGVAYRATQLHGGYGFSNEYPVSTVYRDARVFTTFEGTNEILAMKVIAPAVLKGLREGANLLTEWSEKTPSAAAAIMANEVDLVCRVSELVSAAAQVINQTYPKPDDFDSQSLVKPFGELVVQLYAMVSISNRMEHRLSQGYESNLEVMLAKIVIYQCMENVRRLARQLLTIGKVEEILGHEADDYDINAMKLAAAQMVYGRGGYSGMGAPKTGETTVREASAPVAGKITYKI